MNRIIKVALVALLWIIVTTSAVDLGGDTSRRLDMAHAWWTGQPEIPEISLTSDYKPEVRGEQWMVFGVDNKPYIFYEVGQSVLMLPADWIGTQLHQYFPDIGEKDFRRLSVTFLTFIPLNVATVIACFWLLRIFKVNENLAAFSSIIWLIGSTFLPDRGTSELENLPTQASGFSR